MPHVGCPPADHVPHVQLRHLVFRQVHCVVPLPGQPLTERRRILV